MVQQSAQILHEHRPLCYLTSYNQQNSFDIIRCVCVCVLLVRASPAVVLSMWPCKNISYIQVLIIYFSPTPPIKLKLGLQIGGRLLIATHLDQSNYRTNQKQGALNNFDLTVFIRLFQDSSKVQEDVHFSGVATVFQWINWIWLLHLIWDFQCRATYWALVEKL